MLESARRDYVGADARNLRHNDCDILIVGEAPGPQEHKQKLPFVGPSGQILRTLLTRAGIEHRCVYTNTVKFWPHEGRKTRTPTPTEVAAHRPLLERDLLKFAPSLVILVGETAAKAFGFTGTIGQVQGKLLQLAPGVGILPIYHPAAMLRAKRAGDIYRRLERAIQWALEDASWWLEHGREPLPDYHAGVRPVAIESGAACDTETTGKSLDAELLLVSVQRECDRQPYVYHPDQPVEICNDVIFHNALFDLPILMQHGSNCPERAHDTMVMAWLLGEDRIGLKHLAQKYLHTPVMTYDQMMQAPGWETKVNYSAQDAVLTARLFDSLQTRMTRPSDRSWYKSIAQPLLPILSRATVRGFLVDHAGLKGLLATMWQRRADLQKAIESYAWEGINLGSWQQVGKLLFDKLGLPPVKKTKTGGRSTDDEVLVALSAHHPAVSLLLGWRMCDKMIGTYIKTLLERPTTHTYYQVTGTETGRLSSSMRNLQNLPKKIKHYLYAREGYTFIIADYKQMELRVAAALAHDVGMIEDIKNGVDLHAKLACAVWDHYTMETIPKELRARAKNANFERLYGGGDKRMAETLDVPLEKAKVFSRLFPGLEQWSDRTSVQAARDGYIDTVFGRRRQLWDLSSTSEYLRAKAGRQAINTPVQGTVADMVHLATVRGTPWFQQLGGDFQHQEHDCIIAEIPLNRVDEGKQAITEAMLSVVPDELSAVPIEVDVTVSERWV